MSEIFAPGSVAGPQGAQGPAGSQGSVTALASSLLPLPLLSGNLFDVNKVTAGLAPSSANGALFAAGGGAANATGLIYCPGATSMVSNLSVDAGNWGGEAICLYDANGNFISAIPNSELSSLVNGATVVGGTAWALPGTQVYVRFGYVPSWLAGNSHGWAQSDATGMVYATSAGTATLPASFQPFGIDTVADVNAKVAATTANFPAMLAALQTTQPGPSGAARNQFDYTRGVPNTVVNPDGTLQTGATAYTSSGLVFCPGATEFITNIPIWLNIYSGVAPKFVLYDVNGNFLEDYTPTLYALNGAYGVAPVFNGKTSANIPIPLPGTQTYVRLSWNGQFGSYGYPNSIESCVFYSGTASAPPPALTAANSYVPFAGNAPVNVRTASQLGCSLDGSGDSAAILNAFLATASASNPIKLILDGTVNISTGLVISAAGHTTIEGIGWGSGLNLYASMTAPISINSAGPGAYNVTPPARSASDIVLRNFYVAASGNNYAGIMLANCTNVIVEDLNHLGGTNPGDDFAITVSNASQLFFSRCCFASTGIGHDGIHLDGLVSDVTISDCYFATGDDAIALNAPEGYGGNINRVTVTNCRFAGSLTVMRIYTSLDAAAMPSNNVHTVSNVVVSNCTGYVAGYCFNLGITNDGLSSTSDVDQLTDLSVSNCTLSGPNYFVWVGTPCGSLSFRGIKFTPASASAVAEFVCPVGEFLLDDFTLLRNINGYSAPGWLSTSSGAALDRVSLLNCRVVDQEGSSYTLIPWLVDCSGTIAALRLDSVDMTHIAALFSTAGTANIALLRGGGLLATGTAVPDALVDNNALYLSSTASGAPSIKIAGVARRLTLA
jgi:hypothetical protein